MKEKWCKNFMQKFYSDYINKIDNLKKNNKENKDEVISNLAKLKNVANTSPFKIPNCRIKYDDLVPETVASNSLCKMCPYSKFFWSVFSRIWTEYGDLAPSKLMNRWLDVNSQQIVYSLIFSWNQQEVKFLMKTLRCITPPIIKSMTCDRLEYQSKAHGLKWSKS